MEFDVAALEMLPGDEEQDGLEPCGRTCIVTTCTIFATG